VRGCGIATCPLIFFFSPKGRRKLEKKYFFHWPVASLNNALSNKN
jgi:hypothetical protein